MAFKLCALVSVMAVIYLEKEIVEAMGGVSYPPGLFRPPPPRPPPPPPPPTPSDPFRMNLPLPFQDSPPTIDDSLELYEMGLKRDPCQNFCKPDVSPDAILRDCGEIVEAVRFLATNRHPSVKPECASARQHACKNSWMTSYSCQFKVTVRNKEKTYRLKDCQA